MANVPQIATVPGYILYDTETSSDFVRFLAIILTESTPEGCHLKNAEIAKRLGWSIAKIKKLLDEAITGGYIVEEENGSRTLVVNFVKQEKVELPAPKPKSDDIFDKANIVVNDADIAHLINAFLKAGINTTISNSKAATARFFANPYNRHGTKQIIVTYGMVLAEDVIDRLGKRIKEKWCPKPKSLYSLFEKWERVVDFLDDKKEKGIVTIK